jgi:ABC-2 type transport system ATP-binding protein
MEYPLTVSNLKKTYRVKGGKVEALKGVSFKVRRGEILGLLGPNGAGKTTMINILTGLVTKDDGEIRFFGKKPCEDTQNRINAATAYNSLNRNLTIWQNLMVYAKIYNVKMPKKRAEELLKRFGIYEIKNRKIFSLSSGQKTRVNLCKGLINSPEIVFLDEATTGLDPEVAQLVRDEIRNLDTTVIFTSHIMSEVEKVCDRIAFLSKGKILKMDTPEGIMKLIKSDKVEIEFFSKPENAEKVLAELNVASKSKNKISVKYNSDKDIHKIIHTLITAGFEIRDFHIKRPTLDKVFIKVARGEI